jgi:hypothetical protein
MIKILCTIWKKLKKLIIPLIIAKLVIVVIFIIRGDVISISRDINYSNYYQEGFDNDSTVQIKQKLIRIVRNEQEFGISIKLRGKKNAKPFTEKEREISIPIID